MIIDFHQLSHYYNIYALQLLIKLKTTFILIIIEKDILLDIIVDYNIKLYMKGDQAYTYNLQP